MNILGARFCGVAIALGVALFAPMPVPATAQGTTPLTVVAAPRSFSVISVPVPAELSSNAPITFTVAADAGCTVLGQLRGLLPPATDSSRTVVFTVGIPNHMPAGVATVAHVRFSTADTALDVAIRVTVAAIRRVEVAPLEAVRGVQEGGVVALRYRLTNLGNAPDSVRVRVEPPLGWLVLDTGADTPVPLEMNGTSQRVARLSAPLGSSGPALVRLIAVSHDATRASSDASLEVIPLPSNSTESGPTLTLGAAYASGWWESTASNYTAVLEGHVTDGTTIAARVSSIPWQGSSSTYAFSRANIFSAPPSLVLLAPDWRLGLGLSGMSFSELAGVNVNGFGVALAVDRPRWSTGVMAARPWPGIGSGSSGGELAGARIERRMGTASFWSSTTHLVEGADDARRLDAVALGTGLSGVLSGSWRGEVAKRQFDGGSGLGWSTSYRRSSVRDNLDLRVTHAPGGTTAFARAADEVAASGSRILGRGVALSANAWRSSDDGTASLQGIWTSGWSLGTHVTVRPGTGFSLAAHSSEFRARSTAGDFGDGERALDGELDVRRGLWSMVGGTSAAVMTRSTSFETGQLLVQQAPRGVVRGAMNMGNASGAVGITGHFHWTGPGIGLPQRQWSYGFHVDRLALVRRGRASVYADASVERLGGYEDGAHPLSLLGRLVAEFPLGIALQLMAERNPFVLSTAGRGGGVYVIGLSRSSTLPRVARATTRGEVFRDLNGSGVRDPGESGFEGVVVHRGRDVTVTDKTGRYAFAGQTPAPVEIDPRSVPVGWLAPSTTPTRDRRSVGIFAVSAAQVRLVVSGGDSTRVSGSDLASIVVIARDSSGRAWLARHASPSLAIFDALPPGVYALEVDPSGSSEPLVVEETPRPLVAKALQPIEPVTIVLRARSRRFSVPSRVPPPGVEK